MTVTEPRWRRLEPDERRDQILQAAIRLFGERPYSAVSTSELAAEAGVTRGLLHHYFGTKRGLYLEVVRYLLVVPPLDEITLPEGSLRQRLEFTVEWLLNAIEAGGRTWVKVAGAEGVGPDEEVQQLLDEADRLAAQRLLDVTGWELSGDAHEAAIATLNSYGGMVKAACREWLVVGTLTRPQVQRLLTESLTTIFEQVLPELAA